MLPTLKTNRLTLRPYQLSDAKSVQRLAGEKIIADMTANIPHPYRKGMAEEWISNHQGWFESGKAIALAIELNSTGEHLGTISLTQIEDASGNLGYWVGVPFWGKGYCTEAATALIQYGFDQFGLTLIYARHLPENPASGRVMIKNGFVYQGDVGVGERQLKHYELHKVDWIS
ncbi:GNAT family N-acetyltransferase [Reinekea sp. G2M2-21]|uniref:GNAT family N-acetyltransferase n=1 Tax=Reinekea sp. G2M2-21 TaxID=2788942 RepID=UPI0018A8ECFA|nr:GNAT family N-acetyltransferase [Reinekea sp. G2M2-21]